ncbi:MAG: SpoIIE family protein phosphatase [Desulfobacterales bacterium]|jgi:serine phosphatase RsbU (regulator of sigma subunit)
MPIGDMNINLIRRRSAIGVFFGVFFACANFLLPAGSSASEPVLQLKSTTGRYFLGPYVYVLEDRQKNLTIHDVSSPPISAQFIKHTGKIINLGLNTYAYWIRFTVIPSRTPKKWLLSLGRPSAIDKATLYVPRINAAGWHVKEVGRMLPTGPDLLPGRPADFLSDPKIIQAATVYLRVESSDLKHVPLQILSIESNHRQANQHFLWVGVYFGIMMAMLLYNLILLISLREINRLYYLLYLLSMSLIYFVGNGLWWAFITPGSSTNRTLLLIFMCFAFFWAILFAKSFLITRKNAPGFDKLLSIFLVYTIGLAAIVPLVDSTWVILGVFSQSIIVAPVFMLAGFVSWRNGFRPARFYLIAFATLALSSFYEALANFGMLPYITRYGSQFGSAIEVILLQLALADRIKTISQEQDRIKDSLTLAREVQQNLLPHQSPKLDGLDIAGTSVYCDETGGDYYDYIDSSLDDHRNIGIAIGDVAGHGISSALLMATVRSSLRQRASLPGGVEQIITDVNRQLAQDVEDSGQFMTMFYLKIDLQSKQAHWIRAGHDPAILYDSNSETFEELGGSGIALGVDQDWEYKAYSKTDLNSGQIIFLSTDGIWEAFNPDGEMFGKERIYEILRNKASATADGIVQEILASLKNFQQGAPIEDDITLVIIKLLETQQTEDQP